MKKSLKLVATFLCFVFLVFSCFLLYYFYITSTVKLDKDKLVNLERTITFLDSDGAVVAEQSGGIMVTEIENIPPHVKNAFIAIEDKRFYEHNGVDYKSIARAVVNNAKTLSFKEGASTISQQLIKNTHLTNEKTFRRKILEFKLAKKLEKAYTKEEILQTYLNTIYFGDGCYGITTATRHFFNKDVSELNVNESAMLAGIIKAPSTYSPIHHPTRSNKRKNIVLSEMYKQKYISEKEYLQFKDIDVEVQNNVDNKSDFLSFANIELSKIINDSPYFDNNIKVKTTLNVKLQEIIDEVITDYTDDVNAEKSVILLNKNGEVLAYNSTCGDVRRQLGSIIKPILVYAPAINEDIVTQYTYVEDEKTNFSGYSPSNYNEKYYGKITVKEAVATSSNVCSAKILNYLGVENALKYANKTDLTFTENDRNLSIALGASEKGEKLSTITACYNIFNNNGFYTSPLCVKSITDKNDKILYNNYQKSTKLINSDTVEIMNEILKSTATDGTAKKLSSLNFDLYAKTGTVGNKNGNTDAYIISYNSEYTLGIWLGNKYGEVMGNDVTGGTIPCLIAREIWGKIYKEKSCPPPISSNTKLNEVKLDKISYEQDGKFVLADDNAPERYVFHAKLKSNYMPKIKSSRFTKPEIDSYTISIVNNCGIKIELCHAEYIDALVYRLDEKKNKLVFNTENNVSAFIDKNVTCNKIYQYIIIPYYKSGDKIFMGKEILTKKIKSPNFEFGENWWDNDFN